MVAESLHTHTSPNPRAEALACAQEHDEEPMLHSDQTLCSNPAVSNVHTIIYSLFTIFRRFSGGTPLSLSRPPCDRFPYGLTSPTEAYAWGLRKILSLPPLTSKVVGMEDYAPASFHDLYG